MNKRLKQKIIKNVFSLIVLIIVLLAVYEVLKLDMLPGKYLSLFLIGEGVLFLLAFILYNIRKKVLIIIGLILYILLVIGNIFGYYYLNKANSFLDDSFSKNYYIVETNYYLVADKNNDVEDIDEVKKNSSINYYKYSRSVKQALKDLGKYKYTSTDTVIDSLKQIKNTDTYL